MKIVWSHSRINTLLNNPAEYYLSYVEGIQPKQEKTALSIGSAIHWGLENGTSNLQEYYNDKGSFAQWNNYNDEQCLAECIVEAFLKRKDEILSNIVKDAETGEIPEILNVQKELKLVGHLNSQIYPDGHDFLGIIDLLILTDKGLVLLDYKTSSDDVDWDSYKSQLYKYNFLLKYNFKEIPLYKVGIINLRKTRIRRKKDENDVSFRLRIKEQYLLDPTLINYHIYEAQEFSDKQQTIFEKDLSQMLDIGRNIIENNLYFINYSNITGLYGPSQYYDVFYHNKDSHFLYIIKDTIFDLEENKVLDKRDCEPIDMLVLENKNILNKYSIFKDEASKLLNRSVVNKEQLFRALKSNWICSDTLLEKYFTTYEKNI